MNLRHKVYGVLALAALVVAGALAQQGGGIQGGQGGGAIGGTWTPVLSNSNNVSALTAAGPGQYIATGTSVGSVVAWGFTFSATNTVSGNSSDFHATFPVASTPTQLYQVTGTCVGVNGGTTQTTGAGVEWESPGFHVSWTARDTTAHTWKCTGTYLVQ